MARARTDVSPELAQAYEDIHALTHEACKSCPNEAAKLPYRCCDPVACENARKWAVLKGVTLEHTDHPTLPFMGANGCLLALDLKPLCTMHHCTMNTPRYVALRREIERLEGEDWRQYMEMLNGALP